MKVDHIIIEPELQFNNIFDKQMCWDENEIIYKFNSSLTNRDILSDADSIILDELINSKALSISTQELFWLVNNLESKWIAYLISRYKMKNFAKLRKNTNFPLYLLIEPTSVCNLKCPMCFQVDETFTTKSNMGMMDIDLFKSIIDQAVEGGTTALTLASRGEPTLHPKFLEMIKYASNKFLEIKINTNGTRFNENIAKTILECEISEVVFSIDDSQKDRYEKIRVGANFEKVLENVKIFANLRDITPNKTFTRISGVKLNNSQDWQEMVTVWGKYVDQIGWVASEERWDTYNNSLKSNQEPCENLWERMYVWHDGTVNPCDVDYKSVLSPGHISKGRISEIWGGQNYMKLRNLHLEGERSKLLPCDRCDVGCK